MSPVVDSLASVAPAGAAAQVNNRLSTRATDPSGEGYWLVGQDGGVFAFGAAGFFGSVPGLGISVRNIVGIVATPTGRGYWLIGSDGGVFSFGDAAFHGSLGGVSLTAPIVGASTAGGGYRLVASDGGIFCFGAPFEGSEGGHPLNQPVVAMATSN